MLILGYILCTWPLMFIALYIFFNWYVKGVKSVCIVVLGDIGRSPRMQYHAMSFAAEGYYVDIVGYSGSRPHQNIVRNENIKQHYMFEPPILVKYMPRLVAYFLKVIWQSACLGIKLLLLPKSRYIVLQNPPSIPTIAVAIVVCIVRRSLLIIDWHNYGYTIMSLTLGDRHPLVKFSKWYEGFFGRFSTANLCVTNAMRKDLKQNWNISAETLYDRPPEVFHKTSLKDKHDLMLKLAQQYPVFGSRSSTETERTACTVKSKENVVAELQTRPALVVSSTSWTEDEDFGILLEALQAYDSLAEKHEDLPDIICAITGKGPQKEFYRQMIADHTWTHVQFCLPWLEAEDYPKLLGSADLGVCLHKSSSGLDLPMKVVDMFGCGLPVCAIDFHCLKELVQDKHNGRIFTSSSELCQQIQELLKNFPRDQKNLKSMQHNLTDFQNNRWHDNWKRTVLPLLKSHEKSKTS